MKLHAILMMALLPGFLLADARLEELLAMPAKKKAAYTFDARKPLAQRVTLPPAFVYDYLTNQDLDPSYRAYMPPVDEMRLVSRTLERLPPLNRRVLTERLLGIYFIENFQGSGMADFVLDERTNFYFIIVVNRAVLTRNLSEQFTFRERSCFRNDRPGVSVRIDCGTNEKGLLYIMLHESTHAVDYARQVNPFVEEPLVRYLKSVPKVTEFTRLVWLNYGTPLPAAAFPGRELVTFYGFNKGPKLSVGEAPALYGALTNSGFVSLYGSQNWAEDLADLVTIRTMTGTLGIPYRILIQSNANTVACFEPASSPKARARFASIDAFFQ